MELAGTLLAARLAAGLTQAELAELAATSQSAIACYESGVRQPSWQVLERLVAATGYTLEVSIEPDTAVFTLADLAGEIRATQEDARRMRLVFEFLRAAQEDGHALRLLVAAEPQATGDERFDALLAAVAEDLSVQQRIRPPSWARETHRFLDGLWWVSSLPSARARALVHSPASYRRRGIMIDRHDLIAA